MPCRPPSRTFRATAAASAHLAVALLLGAAILAGCDDKKDHPPAQSNVPQAPGSTQPSTAGSTASLSPAASAADRPTTQQLVSGKRKTLNLSAYHLTIEVPDSWRLESIGSATYIVGATPSGGDVRIHLAPGAQMKADPIKAMEKKAIADAQAHPDQLEVKPLLNIGGNARMMERREFRRNVPIVNDDGSTHNADRVDWSVMVFLPDSDQFLLELLDFSAMPLQQYQADKDFLEGIVRSLHYEATGGAL